MRLGIGVLVTLVCISNAQGAEYLSSENTAAGNVRDQKSPLDAALQIEEQKLDRVRLRDFKQSLEDSPAWIRDASLGLNLRSYDFSRENQNGSRNEASTLGGELGFVTGKFARIARIGVSYYYSGGLYAPEDKGNTGLLTNDQQNLSVIGKAYLLLGDEDRLAARLYRQTLDMPYLNKDDSRMIPNTHEGYLIGRQGSSLDFVAGHVTKMKRKNSEEFIPMSVQAGALDSDEGVTVAGLKGSLANEVKLGVFNYYGHDTFNTLYGESSWLSPYLNQYSVKAKVQYTDQRSVGDELIGNFDTHSFGLGLSGGRNGTILNLSYTQTDSGSTVLNPWGGIPSYNSMMLQNFDRAGEKALRIGMSMAGRKAEKKQWSGFINIVHGWDAVLASTGYPLDDVTEYDFTLDYKPLASSRASGLWLRMRAAYAEFEDGSDRWNLRLVLNYPLTLL